MEGNKRSFVADHGIAELGKYCDSLITIPNQKLLTVLGPQRTLLDAFKSGQPGAAGCGAGYCRADHAARAITLTSRTSVP